MFPLNYKPFLQSSQFLESTACWAPSWCLAETLTDYRTEVFGKVFKNHKIWRKCAWQEILSVPTYGCSRWWCEDSWAAVSCTRGFSWLGCRTWSWGWSSPCSAPPSARQTSTCSPALPKHQLRHVKDNYFKTRSRHWAKEFYNGTVRCARENHNICTSVKENKLLDWWLQLQRLLLEAVTLITAGLKIA